MSKYSFITLWNITDTDVSFRMKTTEKAGPSTFKTPKGKDLDWHIFGEDFYLAYEPESGRVHALINQENRRKLRDTSRSDGATSIFTTDEDKIWRNFYKIEKDKSSTKSNEVKIETPIEKFDKKKKIREIAAELKKLGYITSLSTLTNYFNKSGDEVTLESSLEMFKPNPEKEITKEETIPSETTIEKKKEEAPITLVLEEEPAEKPLKNKPEPLFKGSWQESYLTAITKYSDLDIDKKTNEKRRTCTGMIEDKKLNIDLNPTPEFAKRREQPAHYKFEKGETPNKVSVSIKANQFKDFAILFKAAKENGVSVIEFNKTQTDEFRHLALAAALSLGMEVKNAPGMVDLLAEYLTRMPPKAREALEKHNERIRKNIEKNKINHTSKPKPFVKPVKSLGD